MKRLLLILLLACSVLSADDYTFTDDNASHDHTDDESTLSTSDMSDKAAGTGTTYIAKNNSFTFHFSTTLSAGDITRLKALFSDWTPSGF